MHYSNSVFGLVLSLVSLSTAALVAPGGQTTIAFGSSTNCLSAPTNADGAAVSIQPCSTSTPPPASQLWTLTSGTSTSGTVKIYSNKCLDVTNGVNSPGTKLQIWTCATGNTNQVFNVSDNASTGAISWSGTGQCVDLTDGSTRVGNQAQVWTCTGGPNQKWTTKPTTPPPAQNPPPGRAATFQIVEADPNFVAPCILASNSSNGAAIIINECRGQAGIFWTVKNGGASSSTSQGPIGPISTFDGNFCLDLTAGNTASGTKLQVWSCTGGPNQLWRVNGDGTITFAGNGSAGSPICVDLTDGKQQTGSNTQLQVWSCVAGNSNQNWKPTASVA